MFEGGLEGLEGGLEGKGRLQGLKGLEELSSSKMKGGFKALEGKL